MTGFIPQEKIDEIRNTANIVDVISQYVALRKAGKNFVGLCPFHGEKTPSFTVSQEKQMFHCFGCGQGGSVFNFLMLYHNVGFPEAVRQLGQKYGIVVSTKKLSTAEKKELEQRSLVFDINKEACRYYQQSLNAPTGGEARQYLAKRKIGEEIIERFSLGFAPKGWENIVRFFGSKRTSMGLVEKAGLVIKKKGGFYDRFRSRVVFPITDIHGRVLGFGGRALDDSLPKYLNSPETLVYHKGRTLYGLEFSRGACRRENVVFVVEGYFDLLALHSKGVENVVATLGTALTKEHIRILKGFAGQVILVFDSDEAGIKAAERSLPIFAEEMVDARVLTLPTGHDPDSFVMEFDGDAFLALSQKAMGMVEFLISTTIEKYGLSLQGKVKIVEALKKPLASLTDGITRSVYIKHLAERLNIDESAILEKIRDAVPAMKAAPRPESQVGICKLEETLVAMMLRSPEVLSRCNMEEIVKTFETDAFRLIGKMILDGVSTDSKLTVADLIDRTTDPKIRNVITSLSLGRTTCDQEGFLGVVRQYQNHLDKKNKQLLSQKIKEAEKAKDDTLVFELLAEKQKRIRKDLEPLGGS